MKRFGIKMVQLGLFYIFFTIFFCQFLIFIKLHEQVVGIERAHTLTEDKALQMRAKQTCVDALGKKRSEEFCSKIYFKRDQ